MWQVDGEQFAPDWFSEFEPEEVLYEFDGPRIFTINNGSIGRFLVYLCTEHEEWSRYIVVPTDADVVGDLLSGSQSVRDALSQPWVWVVDRHNKDSSINSWRTTLNKIPKAVLPASHVMLMPGMEPLINIKLIGDDIGVGGAPASVFRRAVDGVSGALKTLFEFVLELPGNTGRPAEHLRDSYDLIANRVSFASLEVSFRPRPPSPMERLIPDLTKEADRTMEQVGAMLREGIDWATSQSYSKEAPFSEQERSAAVLEALAKLTPPQHGRVREVHLGGRMLGRPRVPIVLTRFSAARVRFGLSRIGGDTTQVIHLIGRIREFDKDKLTFILRNISAEDASVSRKCSISYELYEDAINYFESDELVAIFGRERTLNGMVKVIAMDRASGAT